MMLIIAMSALAQVYGDRGRKVMSEINVGNNYGSLGVANVTDPSTSKLGHTASVQFMFAMLQLELAQSNKDAAVSKINGIKESQEQSKTFTDQMNELRNMQTQMSALQDKLDQYGGTYSVGDLFSKSKVDAEITNLTAYTTEISNKMTEVKGTNNLAHVSTKLQTYVNGMDGTLMVDMQRGNKDEYHYHYELEGGLKVLNGRLDVLKEASALYDKMSSLCEKAGINVGDSINADTLKSALANFESKQQAVSADIQQEMVYVNDFMGQYNSFTQGSSSMISQANDTLKTVARGN